MHQSNNLYYIIYNFNGIRTINKDFDKIDYYWPATSFGLDKNVICEFLCLKEKYRTTTFGYCKKISLGVFVESTDLKHFFRELTFNHN